MRCVAAVFAALVFNPACTGCSVTCCSEPVDGQTFAFEIKFPPGDKVHQRVYARACAQVTRPLQAPRDVCLSAADDVTRQRCVRAIQAASAGGGCSSLQDIASAVALSRDLIGMQSLSAVNAVLAALGKAAAKGLDANSLKDAGFDCSSLVRAGFDAAALKGLGFSTRDITFAGCMTECCVVR